MPAYRLPRRFQLHRDIDVSQVSGTGLVAEGVLFADNSCVIRWLGEHVSTVVWSDIADAIAVHGHGGMTRFVYIDQPESDFDAKFREATDRYGALVAEAIAKMADIPEAILRGIEDAASQGRAAS